MKKVILLALVACAFSFTAKAAQTCREGQEEYFSSPSNSGEGDVREIYICHSGRFVPKYRNEDRYVPTYPSCREGQLERWDEFNGETSESRLYVCKSGRFVPVYGSEPARNDAPRACREGSRETFTSGGGEGEPSYTEHYICRHGRYVRTNN